MEEYKQYLCTRFDDKCISEDTIYEYIKDKPQYKCNFNEEDKLHSNYMGSYYEPAIIYRSEHYTRLYWLFGGEIKDCDHPFSIFISYNTVDVIRYYSSERIRTGLPIMMSYDRKICTGKVYHPFYRFILDCTEGEYFDESLFTSKFYPLCDSYDSYGFKLKFAD